MERNAFQSVPHQGLNTAIEIKDGGQIQFDSNNKILRSSLGNNDKDNAPTPSSNEKPHSRAQKNWMKV